MGYTFLRYPGGKAKAVTLSYDDAWKQDIKFSGILNKYNMKCTFNLVSDELSCGRGLSDEDVKNYILSQGHEIAVHGYMHRAEGMIRPIEGIRDILDGRIELEKKYGIIVRGMAYPDSGITDFANSITYETVKNYLKELDIAYARTLGGDNNSFNLPEDWHKWTPTAHHNNPLLMEYVDEFISISESKRQPKLFYLWGHSWEFDSNHNWDLIENVCDKFSKDKDIWFATNIKIYNYVQAYNSLIYSANSKIIYNPTLFDIWIVVDGSLHCIKSGETTVI